MQKSLFIAPLFFGGLFLSSLISGKDNLFRVAYADIPEPIIPAISERTPRSFKCKLFEIELSSSFQIDTADNTSEIGQWIKAQGSQWEVESVDLEIAQKPTGYPQSWVQVCLVTLTE